MFFRFNEKPIAKARHRTFIKGKKFKSYDPQHEKKYDSRWKLVKEMLRKGYLKADDGALHLTLSLGIPQPPSWSHARKERLLGEFCTAKPDLDNYLKYYCDVMNGIVYHDDSQITSIVCTKVYSEESFIEIEILNLPKTKSKDEVK